MARRGNTDVEQVSARTSVRRRSLVATTWGVTVVLAAAVGAWGAWAAFVPPRVVEPQDVPATYVVEEATVGSSMEFPVSLTWEVAVEARSGGEGTMTSRTVEDGAVIDAGAQIFALDLRPVVAMKGATPSFRDLGADTEGDDVRQLQEYLRDAGYLRAAPSGRFGPATVVAVRAWQKDAGYEIDGAVRSGDIVFVPELPARVRYSEDVRTGVRVSAGQVVIEVLTATPRIEMRLLAEQVGLVPTEGSVEVSAGERTWEGVVSGATLEESGETVLGLTAPDGGPVCGQECGELPVVGVGSQVGNGRIVVVPDATGPAVPAAALVTRPDGRAYVVLEDGTEQDVTVVAEGRGRAVIDGVAVGETVRLFGDGGEA